MKGSLSHQKKHLDKTVKAIIADTNTNLIKSSKSKFSIEVFPPKTEEGRKNLITLIKKYFLLGITHVNVTGRALCNKDTLNFVKDLKKNIPECVFVPHIVACGSTEEELEYLLQEYTQIGITNMFAVAGDVPANVENVSQTFLYASDLVFAIKQKNKNICIGVAGYPAGHYKQSNFITDMHNLKTKVDAGADYIITQLFFSNNEFYDFVERCNLFDINVPVLPGITGLKSKDHALRMAGLACGSLIPSPLLKQMYEARDINKAQEAGDLWLEKQTQNFIQSKEPLIHFYVFNTTSPFENIIKTYS